MKTAAHFPFRNLVVSVSMLTLLVCHSLAQVSNASISGVVRDASGAIVPDANVSLRNLQTNVERKTVTNGSGEYVFPQVLPGTYSIQVSKAGFETSNIPSLTLTVSQKAVVDVTLNIGQVSQSINVQATGEQIEPSSAGLGGTVTERQVVNLPLNGRNFTQLITLSPGVSPISVGQNAGGGEAAVANGSNFVMAAIEGQTNRSTFYLTDGINNTDNFFGTYGVAPLIDTLEEFKVNTHPDDAQFGGALGGTINAVTKSGTNQLHGSLWEFVRNDVFDARNTFLKSVTPYRQNQYGFTVGGPVILPKLYNGRNKTFFFGGMEWFKFRQPSQNFLLVPTPSQLNGNLSDLGVQIYNPCTTTMTSSGTICASSLSRQHHSCCWTMWVEYRHDHLCESRAAADCQYGRTRKECDRRYASRSGYAGIHWPHRPNHRTKEFSLVPLQCGGPDDNSIRRSAEPFQPDHTPRHELRRKLRAGL